MKINFKNITAVDYELLKNKYSEVELIKVIDKIEDEDYPVQYAIGDVPFLNTTIKVDERALIPRFATELLVEKAIKYIKQQESKLKNILDLCTGSGAISIALKKNLNDYDVTGIDISEDALSLARENAAFNKVPINFIELDVLSGIKLDDKYSVIISNPPYVKVNEEVSSNTRYEPSIALYPGQDDIIFYKKIIDDSENILDEGGMIAFEIGATQGDRISSYIKGVYPDSKIILEKDYEGFDRFIFIFLNKQ